MLAALFCCAALVNTDSPAAHSPAPGDVNPLPAGFLVVLFAFYGLIASLGLAIGVGLGSVARHRIRSSATWRSLDAR